MGTTELALLAEGIDELERQRLGSMRFEPDRVPILPIITITEPMAVDAAVLPASYRLVRRAIEGASQEILLYVYDESANYLLILPQDD